MTFLLAIRRAPFVRLWPLLIAAAAIPFMLAWAKGWFYAHPLRVATTNGAGLVQQHIPYEEITLRTTDGILLSAWYTPPLEDTLILVGHGYASVRSAELHALFARHGFGVLSWDFRARGKSQGALCTAGRAEALDVEAALDYALAQTDGHFRGSEKWVT
jgi:dipeptidyl aminopeptidase/acylaminoacyl peptidase